MILCRNKIKEIKNDGKMIKQSGEQSSSKRGGCI